MQPIVELGIIPKHLAQVFPYTPPLSKPKSQCKFVKKAYVITSEKTNKWKGLKFVEKEVGEETPTSFKAKLKLKTPQIVGIKGKRKYYQGVSYSNHNFPKFDSSRTSQFMFPKYLKYTNADLKLFLYVSIHIKTIRWKFDILNPTSSRVICQWSL